MGAIVKKKGPYELLKRDADTVFDEFFGRNWLSPTWGGRLPQIRQPVMDLSDEGNRFIATVEVPGLKKEDIKINVSESALEISAEKKADTEEKRKNYYSRERSYSGFYRSMALPSEVDPEKVKARYTNGLLEIELPKVRATKPGKEVKVD